MVIQMLDNITIELVSETYVQDDIGQQIPTPVYRKVYAGKKSIQQNEFLQAGQQKIKPAMCFVVRQGEYKGETKIRYPVGIKGKIYTIYRTFETKKEKIELYCEARN